MLSEEFISRLSGELPGFYERVNASAKEDAARISGEARGDLEKALLRARLEGAAKLWWPYVKGTVPFVGRDREAMEGFTRIVLTVDHLLGQAPTHAEAARDHVARVLRESLDYERLIEVVERDREHRDVEAAGAAGLVASASALMVPITNYRRVKKVARFVPAPLRVAIAAVIVAAIASVPLVAGYSAGVKAEEAARAGTAGAIPAEATRERDGPAGDEPPL